MKISSVGTMFMAVGWMIATWHQPGWEGILSFSLFRAGLELWIKESAADLATDKDTK